jgi:hypothetical protein
VIPLIDPCIGVGCSVPRQPVALSAGRLQCCSATAPTSEEEQREAEKKALRRFPLGNSSVIEPASLLHLQEREERIYPGDSFAEAIGADAKAFVESCDGSSNFALRLRSAALRHRRDDRRPPHRQGCSTSAPL